jgi:hypothetical protein
LRDNQPLLWTGRVASGYNFCSVACPRVACRPQIVIRYAAQKGHHMKFQTYRSTAGLDVYQRDRCFVMWRVFHKRLMAHDVRYRRRFHSYLVTTIILACLSTAMVIPQLSVLGIAINLASGAILVGLIVILAFRQQRYMNEKIAAILRSTEAA